MRAIVLIVALALRALQAGPDLSANANAISLFDSLDLRANLDGLADDLVTDADWQRTSAPTTVDGVDVTAAHAAAFDLDIYIIVTEDLGFELVGLALLSEATVGVVFTSSFLTRFC